jgi:hypothetical protein
MADVAMADRILAAVSSDPEVSVEASVSVLPVPDRVKMDA